MHVGTCSILVLCTEHQLTCDWQTVSSKYLLLYLDTLYLNEFKNVKIQENESIEIHFKKYLQIHR